MSTDKRVRYTRMFLKESLIKLLKKKHISRITIKELCQDAEINRATYYAHYTDQYDQLKQIEAEFISDINSHLDNLAAEADEVDMLKTTERIVEYIHQNGELCRVLLGDNGDINFQEDIIGILSQRVLSQWQEKMTIESTTARDVFTFIATGSIGVLRKWLYDDNDLRTPSEIAGLIVSITNNGLHVFI